MAPGILVTKLFRALLYQQLGSPPVAAWPNPSFSTLNHGAFLQALIWFELQRDDCRKRVHPILQD
jgi:hypothetical protein